jgi:hypothetical protein
LRGAALGEIEMDAVQVAAARILLDKTLPNLASVEAHNTNVHTTIAAEPISEQAWAEKHGDVKIPVDTPSTDVLSVDGRNGGTIQ